MNRKWLCAGLTSLLLATFGLPTARAQQTCPDGTFSASGQTVPITPLDTNGNFPGAGYRFAPQRDSAAAGSGGGNLMFFNAPVTYQFFGPPASVPLTMTVNLEFGADVTVLFGDPGCRQNTVTASILLDDSVLASHSATATVVQQQCIPQHTTASLTRTITRPVGVPFTLEIRVQALSTENGSARGWARLDLSHNPPGGFLMRCDGYTRPGTLGVSQEASSGLRIGDIFPNPAHGEFRTRVFVPTGGTAFLRIHDLSGRVVHARTVEASGSVRELSFKTGLAPGRYFMQLSQGSHTAVRPVVITD